MLIEDDLEIFAEFFVIVMVEIVGHIAAIRENRDAAIPRDIAFLRFFVVFAVLAFEHQNRARCRNRFRMTVFKNKVIAADEFMFQSHRTRDTCKFSAQAIDVSQVIFVRVLEIFRQYDLVIVEFLTAGGIGILPRLRRFRANRQEVFERIKNVVQAGIPRLRLQFLDNVHEVLEAFFACHLC